jgi:hypothetical protein
MTTYRCLGTGLILATLTAVAFAQAPALNVKMGLWEMTATTNVGGEMPGIDTSKMTPEQKKRMEATMKNAMGEHNTVMKDCMTKEKFNESNFMSSGRDDKCKQVLTTNTATVLEGTVTCTGERAMSGEMHVQAPTPTAFTATMKMNAVQGGRTMVVDMKMAGKWLGADCGDVK